MILTLENGIIQKYVMRMEVGKMAASGSAGAAKRHRAAQQKVHPEVKIHHLNQIQQPEKARQRKRHQDTPVPGLKNNSRFVGTR